MAIRTGTIARAPLHARNRRLLRILCGILLGMTFNILEQRDHVGLERFNLHKLPLGLIGFPGRLQRHDSLYDTVQRLVHVLQFLRLLYVSVLHHAFRIEPLAQITVFVRKVLIQAIQLTAIIPTALKPATSWRTCSSV
jgi:hypothetical protein